MDEIKRILDIENDMDVEFRKARCLLDMLYQLREPENIAEDTLPVYVLVMQDRIDAIETGFRAILEECRKTGAEI